MRSCRSFLTPYVDPETGKPVADIILDTAGQKGTGKWTSQSALDLGAPAPTVAEAVFARCLSAMKAERVEASKALADKGVEKGVLTPHVSSGLFPNRTEMLKLEFDRLKTAMDDDLKGRLRLYLAAEYMIDEDFGDIVEPLCYPDRSILVEMSYSNRSVNLLETVFNLVQEGYEPILAHPERYEFYFGGREPYNVAELEKLIDMGCRFQMNLMSLTGKYGKESIRILKYLLGKGMYSFAATDLHSNPQLDSILAAKVPLLLRRGVRALVEG